MKLLIRISILFALILLVVESKYEIILDRQEMPLAENDQFFFTNHTARIKKFNRSSTILSGCFQLYKEIHENVTVEFEAFNLSGGQYKKIFGRNIGGLCETMRDPGLKSEIEKFKEETNVSLTTEVCPISSQTICVKGWSPDSLGPYLPAYLPGNERWKVTVFLVVGTERLGGMTYYAILRDNQKLFDSKWKK